ncbi:hypothetical protein Y032_0550g3303 [Ancylostoma ceylanicum]|uniref:Uncharacterized protein n=1 Tax=Ancylostoma ceylanicum TaxID=53326 RepID=A0A016WQJ3_9BILA|nr:hypothetical protein Y032_0550g3303 [Ancylostoma ceylanicum]
MAAPKKKAVAGRKRASRMGLNMSAEGERPVDLVTHIQKQTQKQRQLMFDQITAASRINCKGFLENRAHNRVPVPIHEKKRVLLTMVSLVVAILPGISLCKSSTGNQELLVRSS